MYLQEGLAEVAHELVDERCGERGGAEHGAVVVLARNLRAHQLARQLRTATALRERAQQRYRPHTSLTPY